MSDSKRKVQTLVRAIKRRWRQRAALKGAALTLLTALGCVLVLLAVRLLFGLSESLLMTGAGLAGLLVAAVAARYVVWPAFRRISDRQVALFVEERVPELEDRLNSVVELDAEGELADGQGDLIERLLKDAERKVQDVPAGAVVDPGDSHRLFRGAGALLLVVCVIGYVGWDGIVEVRPVVSVASDGGAVQQGMAVAPGNVEIEQGGRQEVTVTLPGGRGQEVTLYHRSGEEEWKRTPLEKVPGEATYQYVFSDVQEPIQYFAEHGRDRSEAYTISLYAFPRVRQIDATYHYPEYTARAPRTEENEGDLVGLKGSTVTLNVQTNDAAVEAELVIDEERRMALEAVGEGRFRGQLALEEPGRYHVRLVDGAGKANKFPREHRIEPVEDDRPMIEVTDPRRDVRANAVEEVLVAADVQDDYGIKEARLTYSVNGADEQSVPLVTGGEEHPREAAGAHRFLLEDLDLEPGDIISYYVEAEDYAPEAVPEATDMYFIEVIPFDQRFRQVNNAGGNMGGGQQSGTVVSQQQIITATWKLRREREGMSEAAFEEGRSAIEQAQGNLKGNIEDRIGNTTFSAELRSDEQSREVVRLLRTATEHMDAAIEQLRSGQLEEALTPERKALNQLLKADALNKERQVALNRQQQGGGGGGSATEQRMTELMDLELDISQDKYETQQQGSQGGQQGQADETLQKVQELARKQEELMRQEQQTLDGEDKKRLVDRLQRDQDELREQAENLARRMRQQSQRSRQRQQSSTRQRSGQSGQTQQQLERATENMRRAEEALRRGDEQEARARQQQALNDLSRIQEEMQLERKGGTREMVEQMARDLDRLKEQEQQVTRSAREASEQGDVTAEEAAAMQREQEEVQRRMEDLERRAQAVRDRAREDEESELAEAAGELLERMEEEGLQERLREVQRALQQGQFDRAGQQGEELQEGLARMDEQMQQLRERSPLSEEEQLARSLSEVRELRRQIEQAQQDGQQGASGGQEQQREAVRQALDRMQQRLGDNPRARQRMRSLQKALRADHTGVRLEGEGADAFFEGDVFEQLSQLEVELARQLDGVALKRKIYGTRTGDVPPAYRDLVEKYYESLSKGN